MLVCGLGRVTAEEEYNHIYSDVRINLIFLMPSCRKCKPGFILNRFVSEEVRLNRIVTVSVTSSFSLLIFFVSVLDCSYLLQLSVGLSVSNVVTRILQV